MLGQNDLCICRTPHYLQICLIDWCPGCTLGCEYFPAFTSSDASLAPFTHYGNYTVPCGKHDVFTFNGTFDEDPHNAPVRPQVEALIFEEKCESDAFIFWSGQLISIPGNLTGHVEVLVNIKQAIGLAAFAGNAINPMLLAVDPALPGAAMAGDFPIIEFNDTSTGVRQVLTYAQIVAALPIDDSI